MVILTVGGGAPSSPWSCWRVRSEGTSCAAWWSLPLLPHPVRLIGKEFQNKSDFTCIKASLLPNHGTTVPRATAAWSIHHQYLDLSFLCLICYNNYFHLIWDVHEVVDPKADGHHRDEECKEELQHLTFQGLLSPTKTDDFWQQFICSS